MILSSQKIKQMVFNTDLNPQDRIIITPVLDWDLQAKPGNCSIDIRLGQKFTIPRRTKLPMLDHLSDKHSKDAAMYKDDHYVPIGDYFVLHPRQFVLGETLEWVHLPKGYAAYVIGRSSWGRDGLIIATATGVHAFFSGVLTLEITNIGEIPILLYPGLTIAQLFIHNVQHSDCEDAGFPSSYAGATFPTSGDPAGVDKRILKWFKEKLGLDNNSRGHDNNP